MNYEITLGIVERGSTGEIFSRRFLSEAKNAKVLHVNISALLPKRSLGCSVLRHLAGRTQVINMLDQQGIF